ncbi:ABC transporter ATP-binding protein [Waltera intestinalis]|uniref:ABC transporter ATP-binding protein n=1 Tax=Waltera intestinalis TaxID=2606635 RepID=A0A6L5YK73_9FIRM|nr:ABC transporter ATP-binding protein [Waltera intestinalis]MST58340.1 ABC transporter ATP-binding protein [Waltera intestinalis]
MNKLKRLWNDRGNQYQYAKWLMQYAKPYLGRISLTMLLDLLVTVSTLVMVQISKEIIDNATIHNGFVSLIVIYIAIMLGVQMLDVISALLSTMLNERFSFGIRKQIYEKIINSHWMDVKKYHTGDLMTRLTSDAGNIADGIVGTIPSIIQLAIELILVFFTLFSYSRLLAVFALMVAPVAALSSWWLGRKLKRLQIKVQESEASYRSFLQESLANLLIVKAFANEKYATDRLVELRENRFYWVFKKTKMGLVSSTVMSLSFQLGYIAAFTYGVLQISRQVITYGTMSVFLTLVNRVQSPVMGLAQQIPRVVSILASAGRIMELQNLPLEEKLPEQMEAEEVGVKVEHLTFGYANDTVLEDVSFQIQPGEFVAIIGESGIGKTTLVRIIMSFMSNIQGKVTFYNNTGEEERANAESRTFIAYVPQGNTLFSGTIRENIRMGKLDATDEEMWEALRLSSGYEFVKELPQGLDTVIGERGHGLSEGQAQRIAIARAFIRKAPFLVLDEATSALDEGTELSVLKGLQQLQPRPTCLIITHRQSILKYCDREIKIEQKKTVENRIAEEV